MALATAALIADIEDILDGTVASPTPAQAGLNWAAAYNTYALTGLANGIPPVTSAGQAALGAALGAAFTTVPGVPATVASSLASALSAFWVASTFAGSVPPVVPAAGSAALVSALTGIFTAIGGTHASKASSIGNAIDVYTKLVAVTFPPGTPFPVT